MSSVIALCLLLSLVMVLVISSLFGEFSSLVANEKLAHEGYKQTGILEMDIPRDLLQEYYIPASIEFRVPWSIIAGLHAVQTNFATSGGGGYEDAFDLPDWFWEQYKISKREWDWQKAPHTEEELKEHVPYEPERDRLDDIIWTVAKYLSSVEKWDSRAELFPKVKAITQSDAKTEQVLRFAWAFNLQYGASGTMLALEPSDLALSLIPPDYLEIYQEVEEQYQIPWNYIAAFHYIETRFGTYVNPITGKLMVSEAGALGHFQFMPATWSAYGVDGNGDGRADPFNVVDAAFSCANFLVMHGFHKDVDKAIFAYNHSWEYVASIKAQASLFAEMPGPISVGDRVIPVIPFTISSPYGERIMNGKREFHKGIDIPAEMMTPIYAFAAGEVTYAGPASGYGTLIIIDHGNGVESRYGHSRRLYVSKGQRVPAGYPIAAVGSEGRSTGPHLHFEIRINGKPVDPLPYLMGN